MQLIGNDIADWNAKPELIAVFHTNAGHVTLNDGAYNADRNISTGNPDKDLVADPRRHAGEHVRRIASARASRAWPSGGRGQGCNGRTSASRMGRRLPGGDDQLPISCPCRVV